MAHPESELHEKFRKYMKESNYAKKFVTEYLNIETSADLAFQKFAKENAAAFTTEGITILHDIITMMKLPHMKRIIMGYPKAKRREDCEEVVTTVTNFTLLQKYGSSSIFLHIPTKLVLQSTGDRHKACGYVLPGTSDAQLLDAEHAKLALDHGFLVDSNLIHLPDIHSLEQLTDPKVVKNFIDSFDVLIKSDLTVDKVYYIKSCTETPSHGDVSKNDRTNTYIAGSKALHTLRDQLMTLKIPIIKSDDGCKKSFEQFKANDTDIFILNADSDSRVMVLDVDIIKSTAKNISELIKDKFDIPPCQVAIDYKGDFIMTSHCLYSILTGYYYLHPIFTLPDISTYMTKATKFVKSKVLQSSLPVGLCDRYNSVIENKLRKLHKRIAKYRDRGFASIPDDGITTNVVLMLRLDHYNRESYL